MNLEFVVSKATTILDLPKEAQDTLDALQKDGDEAELYRVRMRAVESFRQGRAVPESGGAAQKRSFVTKRDHARFFPSA